MSDILVKLGRDGEGGLCVVSTGESVQICDSSPPRLLNPDSRDQAVALLEELANIYSGGNFNSYEFGPTLGFDSPYPVVLHRIPGDIFKRAMADPQRIEREGEYPPTF